MTRIEPQSRYGENGAPKSAYLGVVDSAASLRFHSKRGAVPLKEPDKVFYARHKQRLITEHGLTPAEAERMIKIKDRLASVFVDLWLKKQNRNTQ